ncbi:LuxR C-terminal-related transcriptional regulator [Oscillatoria amoena NRMC-F 0135]|nr:LuxR C-terminal-related transcriptional regulator [Oscillatoria amoena NRMC-F 0135]
MMITADGQKKRILSLAAVLTYAPTGEWEYGVALLLENKRNESRCKALLRAIKRRHNEVHRHRVITGSEDVLPVVHLTNERLDKIVTRREAQILKLLADGRSTKSIAASLKITANTVETYRKKLLQKLGAKNTAELIKNASRVFWLE